VVGEGWLRIGCAQRPNAHHRRALTVALPGRLEKIDIRGNPFKDIPDVAAALSTIPNLKHLFMTLKAEADEDALFSFLPKVAPQPSLRTNTLIPAFTVTNTTTQQPSMIPHSTDDGPNLASVFQLETINGTSIPQGSDVGAVREAGAGAEATAISEQVCSDMPH
jgi:hypothetical protein